jgi:outer membrane biosynthesis protein TonB
VRESTRYSLSGALSILAHAIFVLAFVWAFRVETEDLEFDDELPDYDLDFIVFDVKEIEPDKAQGEVEEEPEPPEEEPPAEEEATPPPVEQPEDPEGEAALPEPEPEPEEPPKPKFGQKSSKIKALVPPNATWTLVLANTRIKKLPFRESATEIMAPLRDFRLLVDDAGFNIWEDFEYVVMGSPDATDQTQAFVAVQYTFGHEEMKAGIERATAKHGMVVDWREENEALVGDPRYADPDLEDRNPDDRQFVLLPGDKVALYLREAFVEQVVAGPDASKGKTSGNFVANIARIRRYVAAERKAGIQLVVEDIRSMVRVGKNFPIEIPSRAELMWEAAKNPQLVIKLDFLETEHADIAEKYWNEHLEDDLRKVGAWDVAGGFIAGTTLERNKRQLVFRYQFNEVSARVTLQMVAGEFAKAMRWSKKEALEAKAERERMWELRQDGKLLPSEAIAAGEVEGEGEGAPEDGEPDDAEGGEPAEGEGQAGAPEDAKGEGEAAETGGTDEVEPSETPDAPAEEDEPEPPAPEEPAPEEPAPKPEPKPEQPAPEQAA